MDAARGGWWIDDRAGVRRRVDAGGVLVGRSPSCDVVLREPRASRSQLLVYLAGSGPRLLRLGRGPTTVNGEAVERERALRDNDVIDVPGARLALRCEAAMLAAPSGWVLQNPAGVFFGMSASPFSVGGAASDNLCIVGWPEQAVVLHVTQDRLHAEVRAAIEIDGECHAEQEIVSLRAGSVVAHGGQTLRLVAGASVASGSTMMSGSGERAAHGVRRAELQFLPRGARLKLEAGDRARTVYLPGQRSELMALLLAPPPPYSPGEVLDDELLISRLWPRASRTRLDLNTLVYRLRKDLLRAGIDATALIRRAPGGGGTQLALAPAAHIELRTG